MAPAGSDDPRVAPAGPRRPLYAGRSTIGRPRVEATYRTSDVLPFAPSWLEVRVVDGEFLGELELRQDLNLEDTVDNVRGRGGRVVVDGRYFRLEP